MMERLVTIVFIFLIGGTFPIIAQELPKSAKLGYGFAKNLVPGKDYVEGQLIVGFKRGAGVQGIMKATAAKRGVLSKQIDGALLMQFPSESLIKEAVPALLQRSDVLFVERNGFKRIPPMPGAPDITKSRSSSESKKNDPQTSAISNDAGARYQWHLTVIRKTAADLGSLSRTPPTVAVIDTGVDYTHPELAGNVILGKNCVEDNFDPFDDNSHGTHVAGIIAAKAGNNQFGEGVSPNSKILAVKVLATDGVGTDFSVACGMQYARTAITTPPVRIINASLGGRFSRLIEMEVAALQTAGLALVAAAGNDNTSRPFSSLPGTDPNTAFRVTATEENDCRTFFSNFSPAFITPPQVAPLYNIAAPGYEIPSIFPDAGFGTLSGTSMSTPIVAGTVALVWGQMPTLSLPDLVRRIVTNGQRTSCGFAAPTQRVDVRKALLGTSENAIIGRILDPFTGKAPTSPVAPVDAKLFSGTSLLAMDQSSRSGVYEMTGLAAGTGRSLNAERVGYVNAQLRTGISIAPRNASTVAGPFTDALPKARAAGDVTITLDWKTTQPSEDTDGCTSTCNGWDLNLAVRLPNSSYVSRSNKGDLTGSPFVHFPRDSAIDREPLETIVIAGSADDGEYKLFVDNRHARGTTKFNPSYTGSQASATIFQGATLIRNSYFALPPAPCVTLRYWYLGNLTKDGLSYNWTRINICTDTQP